MSLCLCRSEQNSSLGCTMHMIGRDSEADSTECTLGGVGSALCWTSMDVSLGYTYNGTQYGSVHMTVHNHLYDMIHVAVQRPVCINSYYGLLASCVTLQEKEFNARTQSRRKHCIQLRITKVFKLKTKVLSRTVKQSNLIKLTSLRLLLWLSLHY